MKRLVNFCWSLFKWGFVLLLLAALSGGGYLYFQLDEEIRRYAEGMLAEHYQHLDVRVGGARFVPGQGVTLYDVTLAEPAPQALVASPSPLAGKTLLHLGELRLVGRFELQQLMEGKPSIDRVVVRRPTLSATRMRDGTWSVARLLPPPSFGGGPMAPTDLHAATLIITDARRPTAPPIALRNVELTTTSGGVDLPASLVEASGSAEGTLAKRLAFEASYDQATGRVQATVEVDGLTLTSELLASAAALTGSGALSDLQARATASGRVSFARHANGAPWTWGGAVAIHDGAIRHQQLPLPVTEIDATASFDQRGVAVRELSAKLGAAEITAACNRSGWTASAPVAVRGRVVGLVLSQPLRNALPASLQKLWSRFQPSGTVNITASASFDGNRWKPDATIDYQNLSVKDTKRFPYRLSAARGTARFVDDGAPGGGGQFGFNLQALAEGRPVVVSGEFRDLPRLGEGKKPATRGPRPSFPVGWVEVSAPRLRVSEAMLAALRPHPQAAHFATALSPSGEFGVRWKMERQSAGQLESDVEIDLNAIDCRIHYDKFPYPIDHIRGQLTARNGVWSFEGLESRAASGPQVIVASGGLAPENGRQTFRMRLSAVGAPLDESLRLALPKQEQAVWKRLRPIGRISLTTDITYVVGDPAPRVALAVAPYQRSVSLKPDFFEYRLDRVDGRFVMQDGQVTFTGARAEHGRSVMTSSGRWAPSGNGGWRFELDGLHIDYLDSDHELRLAAPLALRRVINDLQPEGSFGLHHGRLAFTYDPARPNDLRTEWDVELDCHKADMTFGVRVEGISGAVRLAGTSSSQQTESHGELQLDTLFWNGLQLTNIRGPLWATTQECLLGEGASQKRGGGQPTKITAQAYGGAVAINTRVLNTDRARYNMAIDLADIDLERFSRDYLNTTPPLTGVANGRLQLEGQGASVYGLQGTGAIDVRDANLYELPVMVSLLKVLRNRSPDTTAFDGASAEFGIQGKHLQFSRLDLLGDAVSLYGRGEASLEKDLNLTFHTIVGRGAPSIPLLRSLVGQASEQILRLRVLGTTDEPDIRRETLPVVGSVLEQLRADLQPRPLSQPAELPQAAALRRQTKVR
ncbi:MAG: AsmA-like C-terminal domain-containing protein [Planctomycetota bacterium]